MLIESSNILFTINKQNATHLVAANYDLDALAGAHTYDALFHSY